MGRDPGLDLQDDSQMAKNGLRSHPTDLADEEDSQTVSEDLAVGLKDVLSKLTLPYLSSTDQSRLVGLIKTVAIVEKQQRSLDAHAMQYSLFFQEHHSRKEEDSLLCVDISWREIVSAYHSESQDILIDLVSKQYRGRMLWNHARESGMFMWVTDGIALVR